MQKLNNIRLEDVIDVDDMKKLLNSFVLATGLGAMCVNARGESAVFQKNMRALYILQNNSAIQWDENVVPNPWTRQASLRHNLESHILAAVMLGLLSFQHPFCLRICIWEVSLVVQLLCGNGMKLPYRSF